MAPTQSTPQDLAAAASGSTATTKRLATARSDTRVALRELNSAIEAIASGGTVDFYLGEAEARLALAIGAVRAMRNVAKG